ncbi:MAG: hypothetical protein KKG47_07975 [Proteobacteria bacterium]|nr:hypothetical protein [Pseudomonadota bacterium]MBU1738236.1 hypothetical protein [Pseudomonadota bacterium]
MKMAPLPDDGLICRVAVLPFANEASYSQADNIFGRVFVSELINTGFLLSQEGDVRKILKQMMVIPGLMPSVEQLRAIADRLGVQVIVIGSVVEMRDKDRYGQKLDPSAAVILRIIEADSGRTLWTTYARREGKEYRKVMHFGLINSVTALSEKMAAEIIETWFEGGVKKCAE